VKNMLASRAERLCAFSGLIRCGVGREVLKRPDAMEIVNRVKGHVGKAKVHFQFADQGVGAGGALRGEVRRLSWRGSRMAMKPSSSRRSAGGGLALLLRFSGRHGSL
jgi:hypothetical protein